ncbi:phosphodiesterase [Pusillimonas sp. TS35]|uniref:phosphodiesterase n=1 Tax=Paracandidimonas lactea TaxID=2895524 RepID=UPI00136A8660|nr:phosphodiesterase [Paracandidimonas lactea]MYN12466.1 phosphodiesterase [Pusillimonas sp. TS35]
MLIAQITDLHIRMPGQKAYRVVETGQYLPPAIEALNNLYVRPDAVIISGDLTDFGRPQEYAHLRQMLDALKCRYFLMPGNHDARDELKRTFNDHAYLHTDSEFLQYTVDDYPVRLLMLDTVVSHESHGQLCPVRLAWLAERLAEQPGRPTIIAMHHPPFETGIAHMDAMGLLEGAPELERLVARYPNIERIICGHVHRTIFRRFGGTVVSICPSTAHQIVLDLRPDGPDAFIMEPSAFHLHEWRGGALITHHAYIGKFAGPYPFREEGALIDE